MQHAKIAKTPAQDALSREITELTIRIQCAEEMHAKGLQTDLSTLELKNYKKKQEHLIKKKKRLEDVAVNNRKYRGAIKQGLADLREEFPEADRHLKKRCSRDEPGQPAFEDRAGNEGLMEAILDIVLPGTASLTLKIAK